MSRYKVESRHPALTVEVGWDAPLETFFGQVTNPHAKDETEEIVEWLGATHREIPTVEALALGLQPYAEIAAGMREQLTRDRQEQPQSEASDELKRLYEKPERPGIKEEGLKLQAGNFKRAEGQVPVKFQLATIPTGGQWQFLLRTAADNQGGGFTPEMIDRLGARLAANYAQQVIVKELGLAGSELLVERAAGSSWDRYVFSAPPQKLPAGVTHYAIGDASPLGNHSTLRFSETRDKEAMQAEYGEELQRMDAHSQHTRQPQPQQQQQRRRQS